MGKLRWTTQFIALALANLGLFKILEFGVCGPFFYCYGCPAAAFACPIGVAKNYAAHYTVFGHFPFYAIGTIGLFGLALGRFWCGWFCPFGLVQDLVLRIRGRQNTVKLPRIPWMKFLVLGLVLLLAWIATDTLFCKICPAGSLFAAIPHRFISPEFSFGRFFYVHLVTLAIALVAFYFIARFWCRYLCPLGAIFGAFNPVSILKVRVDFDKCNECRQCLKVCPVGIEEPEEIEKSTDCIRCGKCVEACEDNALTIAASLRR